MGKLSESIAKTLRVKGDYIMIGEEHIDFV